TPTYGWCYLLGAANCGMPPLIAEVGGCLTTFTRLGRGRGIANMAEDGQPPQIGHPLPQQFEPLTSKLGRELRQTGDVTPWPREARHESSTNRIIGNCKDDRDS